MSAGQEAACVCKLINNHLSLGINVRLTVVIWWFLKPNAVQGVFDRARCHQCAACCC